MAEPQPLVASMKQDVGEVIQHQPVSGIQA
jgi:hypothetical protein